MQLKFWYRIWGRQRWRAGLVLESRFVTNQPQLILASNSPRRRQLLSLAGWQFTASAANVDESEYPNELPSDYVLRLAETKARAIQADADQIILAADTTVVDGMDILGKPKDSQEATAMLRRLRGHTHQVYTALLCSVQAMDFSSKISALQMCPMRDYSDEENSRLCGDR